MKTNKNLLLIIIILVLVAAVFYLRQLDTNVPRVEPESTAALKDRQPVVSACHETGGKWVFPFDECEYVSEAWCADRGGRYHQCESACRHKDAASSEPVLCTMQCVQVCELQFEDGLAAAKPEDVSFMIDGFVVTLDGGYSEGISPTDPTRMMRTRVFGPEQPVDLDGDGDLDSVMLLQYDPAYNGTSYYVVAGIKKPGGFVGTEAVRIGDHINPQTVTFSEEGEVQVNYCTERPWDGYAGDTGICKTKRLGFDGSGLETHEPSRLGKEEAYRLAVDRFGECTPDSCDDMYIAVLDGVDGVWFVQVTKDGLRDDSVRSVRHTLWAHHIKGEWILGDEELYQETKCQPGRGHQEFEVDSLCM